MALLVILGQQGFLDHPLLDAAGFIVYIWYFRICFYITAGVSSLITSTVTIYSKSVPYCRVTHTKLTELNIIKTSNSDTYDTPLPKLKQLQNEEL
jgi:hypothetical protein